MAPLIISRLQKYAAQSIVNDFETGTPRGNYADVTMIKGDTGHLTYGRSQTTLGSGNLLLLLQAYCAAPGAAYADAIRPYLLRVSAKDYSLDYDTTFRALLKEAGREAIMQSVQDIFFDKVYWQPAFNAAQKAGVQTALGAAIFYDGTVHGSLAYMANRTIQSVGNIAQAGEVRWLGAYLDTREYWLGHNVNPVLHNTVYRTKTFRRLLKAGNYTLALPFTAFDCTISVESMALAWELQLNAKRLGDCYKDAAGDNYFPVRGLLEAIFGEAETDKSLAPSPQSSALTGGAPGGFLWKGKLVPCLVIARPGATWGKVRDLAMWLKLDVTPVGADMVVNLTRGKS